MNKYEISPKSIKSLIELISGAEKLEQKNRENRYSFIRFVYMKLSKEYTLYSLNNIGKTINRNHASVIHGIKMFSILKNQYQFQSYKALYYECKKIIQILLDNDTSRLNPNIKHRVISIFGINKKTLTKRRNVKKVFDRATFTTFTRIQNKRNKYLKTS